MAIHTCFHPEMVYNGRDWRKNSIKSFSTRYNPGKRKRQALRKSQRGPVIKIKEISK